jgi:DNA-binding FadR family transcriptional regulator
MDNNESDTIAREVLRILREENLVRVSNSAQNYVKKEFSEDEAVRLWTGVLIS